ncbi:MAG: GGDEF domain-containing protein [Deltaproteobacteria bacterium]|nr:GGDEF domain-containing protein [Deltaproteobacteria bacterium]
MRMMNSKWGDRRHPCRWIKETEDAGYWLPERKEILTQFFTRYLFFALAVLYFSSMEEGIAPVLFDRVEYILLVQGIYFGINTWFFHLSLKKVTLWRIRGAMAGDLLNVTICLIHDPYLIPPAALGFLMILLGNGMRYGMRLFGEILGGTFLCMALAFALRYRLGGFTTNAGVVFFGVFWVTLAMYAYILMGRIDDQRRQLDYRSRYDALTSLLNRHGLLAAADNIFEEMKTASVTLLLADLNHFKAVNDLYGHSVGDRVLTEFAQIFCESAEVGVCGRWGGDEFVSILPRCDEAILSKIKERIELRTQAWSKSNGLPMSVSLGIGKSPSDGQDLAALLSAADMNLYKIKTQQTESGNEASGFGALVEDSEV